MNFIRKKIKDTYLDDTLVENMFLIDYMPDAEGDFVKVYLTGLLSAGDGDASNSRIASHLNMDEERVMQAWNHWEKCGVIRKYYPDPEDRFHYEVEFLSLKEQLYSPDPALTKADSGNRLPKMQDEDLRTLFVKIENICGRMLEGKEPEAILTWLEEDGLPSDLIVFAYEFSANQRKNTHFQYVSSIIRDWISRGFDSVAEVRKQVEETEQNFLNRKRVMQALGFRRNPTEAEAVKIDSWFEELDCSMEMVLNACAKTTGISNPNINYVDKVLRAWAGKESAGGSSGAGASNSGNAVQQVMRSYEEARKRHREEMESHTSEIYQRIPSIKELDEQIRRTNVKIGRASFRNGRFSGEDTDSLRQDLQRLSAEKKQLLEQAGYPEDYMEIHYDCPICEDSGITRDGARCSCFTEKLRAIQI